MTANLSPVQEAGAELLARQKGFVRRKDTLAAIAGGVLQLAQFAAVYEAGLPFWVSLVIGVVVAVCQIIVHAATPGAITPMVVERIAAEAERLGDGALQERLAGEVKAAVEWAVQAATAPSGMATAPVAPPADVFSVYHQHTTAGE